MQTAVSALTSVGSVTSFVGVLLLLVVIYTYGHLLGLPGFYPFAEMLPRIGLCIFVFLVWLGIVLWRGYRRSAREKALAKAAADSDPTAVAKAEEEAELAEKLTGALAKLKAAGGKGGYLYELPWYVLIGPPGSGKTTALVNSGIEFPLSEGAKLQGVGGTRFCDWWLSDQAVLIDTAGRYTSQDSDATVDKAGWERFLELLRRNRPRQPLNGVIVAFGVDMLAKLDAAGREGHARNVRRRIRELEEKLGQKLPVYMLVTKADLLPGFVEFFDDLDRETRNQVWGTTFSLEAGPEGTPLRFGAEFKALLKRLEDRVLERLQAERGPQQRALIAGFPAQFASLEEPVQAFLTAAFAGTRLDPAPMLRGVYFTSGTQEGTPIDRLTGALSRAFGLDPRRPASVMQQKGRSYFLGRLLKDVVFNEARLAARDRGAERRGRIVAIASWTAALLAIGGGAAWGWMAYSAEQKRASVLATQVSLAERAAQGLPLDRVAEPDFLTVLPYLDAARGLGPAARQEGGAGLGLSQREKLETGAQLAYARALDRTLLPRLLARLEQQIRGGFQRPDFLYEAVRVYLMLGREGPMDAAMVREWFAADWLRAFPGATREPQRDALLQHLDALLARDFPAYPLDGRLVDEARRIFSRLPLAERIYSRLKPMAQAAPPWRPVDALGASGQRFFTRASGRPLTEGVPGAYTVEGLHRVLLPALPAATRAAAEESWVLGPEARAAAGAEDPQRLEAAVLELYAREYVQAWQAVLDDLVLPPFGAIQEAAQGLNLLGAPNSPLRDLMRAIARQLSPGTNPDAPPPAPAGAPGAPGNAAQRIAAATGGPQPSSAEPVARVVERQFQTLRDAAGQPTEDVLRTISELYVLVQRIASSPPGTVLPAPAPGSLDPGQRLEAEAARLPDPLGRWLKGLAQSIATIRFGGAKAAIAAAGAQQLAPLCRNIEQRFPFRPTGADMPVDDFARLFGPGGVFDQFFAGQIRPFVDTTQNPWRPVAAGGMAPPVIAADVQQFQRAQAIRDAFFPGGAGLGLRFELVPTGAMDPGANTAVLEAEGLRNEIARGGPFRPIPLAWPARGNLTLTFDPPSAAGPLTFDGGWSGLRLVIRPQSTLQTTPQRERLRLNVVHGDRSIAFELRAGSVQHPFGLPELTQFRCPTLAP